MPTKNRTWRRLGSALVVAAGVAIVWGLLVGWGAVLANRIFNPRHGAFEKLVVTVEGEPLISRRTLPYNYDYLDTDYRTLDGETVDFKNRMRNSGMGFGPPASSSDSFYKPLTWQWRTISCSDRNRPPVRWYGIRNNAPDGLAYFEGYDSQSKRLVGYIGRRGFSRTLPPEQDWFDIPDSLYGWYYDIYGSGQRPYFDSRAQGYFLSDRGREISESSIFLIDGDQLQEIDLRGRAVRTIFESPSLTAVALLAIRGEEDVKAAVVFVIQMADRIVLLDPSNKEETVFVLPESMREGRFSLHAMSREQLLLTTEDLGKMVDGRNNVELAWLTGGSDSIKTKKLSLEWPLRTNLHTKSVVASLLVPVPVAWGAIGGSIAPVFGIQDYFADDFDVAREVTLSDSWPGMIVVGVMSLVTLWFALRSHKKYRRPNPGVWCVFVFLLGVPGLIAYWLEHRRPVLEPCTECGKTVPRDREACADCGTEFPPPPLVGTEILA